MLKKAKKEAKKRGLLNEEGGITANLLEEDLLGHRQSNNVGKIKALNAQTDNTRSSNSLAYVGNLNNTHSSFNYSGMLGSTELK